MIHTDTFIFKFVKSDRCKHELLYNRHNDKEMTFKEPRKWHQVSTRTDLTDNWTSLLYAYVWISSYNSNLRTTFFEQDLDYQVAVVCND